MLWEEVMICDKVPEPVVTSKDAGVSELTEIEKVFFNADDVPSNVPTTR